jgi:beta-mannosidase
VRFLLASTSTDVATPADLPEGLDWVVAEVPGGVHESLIAAGVIPHPYRDENEDVVRWVEDRVWWYRATFEAQGRQRLVLPSVDTVADVFVDGVKVGSHANAFRPFEVELDLAGSHELVVRIQPPLHGLTAPACSVRQRERYRDYMASKMDGGKERAEEGNGIATADLALTLRRKPTFSWGWDFAPKIASVGLLEQPVVEPVKDVRITGHHVRAVRVDVEARTAVVALDVEVTGGDAVRVRLTSPTGTTTAAELAVLPGSRRTGGLVVVSDAELWWTHDLGTPALYDLAVELVQGEVVDRVDDRVGLRTIELDQSADPVQEGRLFRFLLNGVPTFSRGANWVPASMLRGSVTAEQVRGLVELSAAGEMTMLRIWGGGAYEQDAFYDACDELGVLVWQDFMFACTDYPSHDLGLQAEVLAEAEFQVTRLRNHPSIALWCGNNEIEVLHLITQGSLDPAEEWGWELFHALLPDAVERWSPGAVYWPSSPWAEGGTATANKVVEGDRHAWEVWHGLSIGASGPTEFATRGEAVHFRRYAHDLGRFISEFGIHASPQLETLTRWTSSPLELGSPALLHRIKDTPKDKGWDLLGEESGHPRDLHEYVDYSMAVQAEGLKFGIEHYRRRQPHCSGTLVWQLNDPWPGLSWSVIDSDLVPKAGYWFLQRVYSPVLASFRTTADGVELWVTNSGRVAVPLELTVDVSTFDGAKVAQAQVDHLSQPGSSEVVWSAGGVAAADRFAWVSERSDRVPANRSFFAPLKELPLGKGTVDVEVEPVAGGARVHLTSHGYSYFTRVTTAAPGPRFSANYLDLRDGQRAVVEVTGLRDAADLRVSTWASRD